MSAMQLTGSDGVHTLVAVELGAEDVVTRNYISKTLLMYGKQVFTSGGVSSIENYDASKYSVEGSGIIGEGVPENPDTLAQLIVWTARKNMEIPEPENIEIPEDAPGF